MKKRARGKRRGRAQGTRTISPGKVIQTDDNPVVLSITPQGATVPGGMDLSETARLRRELEEHARDVEHYMRAQRLNAIVTRVLADIERPESTAPPPLRLHRE
jgi:hypothetical protein